MIDAITFNGWRCKQAFCILSPYFAQNPGTASTMKQIRNKLNESSLQDYKFEMTIKQLQFCRQKCLMVIPQPVHQHGTNAALTQENQMVGLLNDLTARKVLTVKQGQIKAFHSLDGNAALKKFNFLVAKGFSTWWRGLS